jgi:hypothetical protein
MINVAPRGRRATRQSPGRPRPRTSRALLAGALLVATGGATLVAAQAAFEKPAVLRAQDLAPPELLRGPSFQVDEQVPTDGLLAKFTIKSSFGPFEAQGPGMLLIRVTEIKALDALSKMETSEVFKKALADSAKRTGKSLQTAIENPVETVKGLPEGVGRFFERVGRSVKTGAQKAEDYMGQKQSQPGGAGAEDVATAAGQAGKNVGESVIGYDDARRRMAKALQVDPYTTNPVLAKKLDEVAWAAWGGEFGLDGMVSLVPGGMAVTFTRSWVSDLVWDVSPGDLRVRMEQRLKALGVDQDAVDRFLRQKSFTLTIQTVLVGALTSLGAGPGRPDVVAWALTAESELQARFMAGAAGILADYHRTVAPIQRVRVAGTLVGETQSGALVIAAPVDYISWTERAAAYVQRPDLAAKAHQLWVTGRVAPRARQELTARGWAVREGVSAGIVIPGGPAGLESKPAPSQ